jgi:hypothetical protein
MVPRVKRPGREADRSPLPSAEAKNGGTIYLKATIYLHGIVLNSLILPSAFIIPYPMSATTQEYTMAQDAVKDWPHYCM